MRILIAEDDQVGRTLLQKFLSRYGECELAADGIQAIDAFINAHNEEKPYGLICLDIMMPKLDGIKTLKTIRDIEKHRGVEENSRAKVIMTTALNDKKTVAESYESGCEAYAWKPIELDKFEEVLAKLKLYKPRDS